MPALEQGASSGISALLLAFYFRQKGRRGDGDKTFEFTHKSFGEYLAALRVLRASRQICQMIKQAKEDPGSGWDHDQALQRWLDICGPTKMDEYLAEFIRREVALHPENAIELQEALASLYSSLLTRGWPMHMLYPVARFKEQQNWARNAEQALLGCINACARVSKQRTRIVWPTQLSFAESLKRIQSIRTGNVGDLIQSCLSYLELDSCTLNFVDFYGADLSHSSFRNADIILTILEGADLSNADLSSALVSQTNLYEAHLEETNIEGTRIINGYLGNAGAKSLGLGKEQIDQRKLSQAFLELLRNKGARGKPTIEWSLGFHPERAGRPRRAPPRVSKRPRSEQKPHRPRTRT